MAEKNKSKWQCRSTADINWRLPSFAGVYVVFGDHRLLYIGSTENLRTRIKQHGVRYARYSNAVVTPWGRFGDVQIKFRTSRRYGEWLMREARLIRRLGLRTLNIRGVDRREVVNG